MWDIYVRWGEGVAVRSTFAKLRDSISAARQSVEIGIVRYIDYNSDRISDDNMLDLFLHKRLSFAHEQELRALTLLDEPLEEIPSGLSIQCDLETLTADVYVSPTSPGWFLDVVKSATAKYGPKKTIVQSSLADDPVY